MSHIKVSVIIPMYNSEGTIITAIKSVLNQTFTPVMEIIIVNDGSIDNSKKIVEQYILDNKLDKLIRLINKTNGGVSSARNLGIQEAKGEYIALLDSDDEWLPEKMQKQFKEIEKNPQIKFIGTNRNNESYKFFGKQINIYEFYLFYLWLSFKYVRRKIIVRFF